MGARTLSAFRDEAWDFVVLQEYSTGPITSKDAFLKSAGRLCGLAHAGGAVPILYATWAFKRGGKKIASSGLDYDEMYRALYDAYHEAGAQNGAAVADVGARFYQLADERELFASDDYHPNEAGSRLAAQTIAETIRACGR